MHFTNILRGCCEWHRGNCAIGLLPDTWNCGLSMRLQCRERFPRHRLQRKSLVSDPGMHHGTCVTHVPWCMSGSLTRGGGENVPGIPGACATRDFTYLARGPLVQCQWSTPAQRDEANTPTSTCFMVLHFHRIRYVRIQILKEVCVCDPFKIWFKKT